MHVHADRFVEVQVPFVATSAQRSGEVLQHGTSVEHCAFSVETHWASQKQELPATQANSVSVRPVGSYMTQERPEQHWPPPAVQTWRFCAQLGGGVQTPPVQVSVELQHVIVPLHAWPVLAQVGPGVPPLVQVPLVAPGGTLQVSPEQQSAVTVQVPVAWTHAAPQKPPLQTPEQHCAFVEQDVPTAAQDAPQV